MVHKTVAIFNRGENYLAELSHKEGIFQMIQPLDKEWRGSSIVPVGVYQTIDIEKQIIKGNVEFNSLGDEFIVIGKDCYVVIKADIDDQDTINGIELVKAGSEHHTTINNKSILELLQKELEALK